MKKLTIYTDAEVIEQAKRLAAESGTSVSAMFERFVRFLARQKGESRPIGRLTRKASGLIKLPRDKSERDVLADALADRFQIGE
jgi:hypothetical protein